MGHTYRDGKPCAACGDAFGCAKRHVYVIVHMKGWEDGGAPVGYVAKLHGHRRVAHDSNRVQHGAVRS